jgi:uncharacterized protein YkwD
MGARGVLSLDRRSVLAGAGAGAVLLGTAPLARAQAADGWLGYEARLRTLLGTPPGDGFQPEVETQVLIQTNRFRAEHVLPSLRPHAGLERVARAAAADMASRGFFDHHSPEGHAPSARVGLLARELCGASGENIAFQEGGAPPDGRSFFAQWRDSPGHRENMLRPAYTHAGHGVIRVGERTYAVAALAEEKVRLGAEPPLRLGDGDALAAALASSAPRFDRFQLSGPDGEALSPVLTLADLGALPSGAWRLRPHLPDGERRFLVLWGPIFVAG